MGERFALAIALVLAGCTEQPACLRYETQKVVTYPNMAMMALGPAYTALALAPVIVDQKVCIERTPSPNPTNSRSRG